MEVNHAHALGTVTFDAAETLQIPSPRDAREKLTITRARGRWTPPEHLAQYCAKDFAIPLECRTGSDGVRRIVPACSSEELIDMGFVGGLALIHGCKGYSKEEDERYSLMHRILQFFRGGTFSGRRGMQEHLTRQFAHARDLHVRRQGRVADSDGDVLPDDLGLTSNGEGRHWTVNELLNRGREAAVAMGYKNPTNRRAIPLGIYEAADRNPADVETEKITT